MCNGSLSSHLLDEFFYTLHNMLVELDCLDGALGDRGHLSPRHRRLGFIQAGELQENTNRYRDNNS